MEFFAGFNDRIASCLSMKSNAEMKVMVELEEW